MDINLKIWSLKSRELVDLIVGREGGFTTMRIIDKILIRPYNANQLSNVLNLDYNTITYHTKIMQEHNFITRTKFNRSYYFHPTEKLINCIEDYFYLRSIYLNDKLL